jgi:hypothetical protein
VRVTPFINEILKRQKERGKKEEKQSSKFKKNC